MFVGSRVDKSMTVSPVLLPPPYKEDTERANAVIDLRKDIWAPTLPVPSLVKNMDRLTAIKEFLDNIDTQDSQHGWRFLLGIYLVALIGSGPATDSHTGHDGICFEYFRFATWGVFVDISLQFNRNGCDNYRLAK
ncbi:uncharacterized protein N7446_001200 [Penicillium canescens]|uniref:uncharacterized protein n=1 Tax=Penicillium canescens TaxID=5083 RepID=UPI0026DFE09B|nr:uncharacterized protein N7446_001200 [Penicillium canescens]KAJ6073423.1 hypothetical protein N7446_001200 [Penicillium canescens]